MVALVDCNSFYCSVEKVFHPGLEGKPVCVLSNNDGCIVALTPQAKVLGLKRGDPLFKVKDIVKKGGVRVFSGNMVLYAAMSKRVNSILKQHVAYVENYSIDESFCYLGGYELLHDPVEWMRELVVKIRTWTDIPVSVGIAPTKTLAKAGSLFAKRYAGYKGVCCVDTQEKRRRALAFMDLADIWGIGHSTLSALRGYGVRTPLEFADKKEGWVRHRFHLPVIYTWKELNGIPCIDTTEVARRQSICTSRSFGNMITTLTELKEAVTHFACGCANKLRAQRSLAGKVTVFVRSNGFREDLAQYACVDEEYLPIPSADSLEICGAAIKALGRIYRPGILYKKAGVVLGNIRPCAPCQLTLFDPLYNRPERRTLMGAIDTLNHKYGVRRVRLAVEGFEHRAWHVKSEFKSPDYLTDINQLLTVRI